MCLSRSTHYCKILFVAATFIFLYSFNASAQLTANFTVNKNGGCAPLAVNFTNTTSGASANATYLWDFGNGNISNLPNPGAIYTNEKTYTVILTVKDGNLSATATKQITVYTPPLADFTASPVKGCLPVAVNFNATASSGASTYTWDFGDGNTQQNYNSSASHTYTVPQTATVSLTVGNSYGCTKTIQKQNLIKILPAITAAFKADKNFLCRVTDAVQFSNNSTGPGTLTYLWDFGDGNTSTLPAPSHVFNVKGTYTVSLTVTSSEGCTANSTQNGYINVDNFKSDFTVPAPICLGSNVAFTSTSSPAPSSSEWLVDGLNAYYYYYNTLNYNFAITGSHTIELKNVFGTCRDSVSKTIIVNAIPNLQGFVVSKSNNCAAPVLCTFKDTTASAVQWEWNFSFNNSQSNTQQAFFTYPSNGDYYNSLKVTNAAGCSAFTAQYVHIGGPVFTINAEGTPLSCSPYALKFSASSNGSDIITSYNWNFGDGTTSTSVQPTHLFSNQGYWPVSLSYITQDGCTGSVSYGPVAVFLKPVASFTALSTTICGNTPVVFNAINQGGNVGYYWDFGDNSNIGYGFNNSFINHQYTYDSTYSVTLIVSNQGGCSDTLTRKAYIKILPPFPKITNQQNTCNGTRGLVTFSQQSKKAVSWTWDFGDGSTRTLNADSPTISHTYANTGTYKTVLINTNAQCTVRDSITVNVLLKQNPLLTANATQVCTDGSVHIQIANLQNNPGYHTFDNDYNFNNIEYTNGTPYNGYVTRDLENNYYWSTIFNGSLHNFLAGTTGLRVILRSSFFQCLDTTNFIPLAVKGSKAGFKVITDNVCFKLPVVFKDTSTTNNKIVSWQWNFGDGITQTFATGGLVNHVYANPGNYYVSLTVTDSSGCSTSTPSYVQSVTVNGPKAAFYPSSNYTYITLQVNFYNYTNNYNSYNTQCIWQFGDGATSTDYSPVHSYNLPGQYTVKLIASNPLTGCIDTASQVITVNNFVPAFSISSSYLTGIGCPPLLVKMTNNSYNYTSVKWDFGDGTTADNLNYPSHIYEKAGKYIITLYVYGPSGLTGTFTDSVNIQLPQGSISANKKEGCIGLTPTFKVITKNANTYLWDYGDGTVVSNGVTTANHQYNQPGKFIPLLMLIDSNGCSSFAPSADTINIHPDPDVVITPADPRICKGKDVTIAAAGGTAYSWLPSAGLSNAFIANPKANPTVTTTYTVTVKDNIGCSNTGTQKITVVQPGKVNAGADAVVCLGKSLQLNAAGAASYQWIFSTKGLSNTAIGNPVASPLITTTYTVTGTDEYKCFSDTASITIKVLALPTVSIPPVPEVLLGTQVPLISIASSDVVKWNWSPADYLSCSNCPSPVSTPLAQKTYTLTVTNSNGCTASDVVILKLQCQESRVFIPAAFSPNGDGKNDVFSIMGISIVKHLVIYGRWGTLVYERNNFIASDRSTGWDGYYKGEPLPIGAYTYFAEMECPSGGSFTRKGTVILVR
jgi:gliding motility-associated-like protein